MRKHVATFHACGCSETKCDEHAEPLGSISTYVDVVTELVSALKRLVRDVCECEHYIVRCPNCAARAAIERAEAK